MSTIYAKIFPEVLFRIMGGNSNKADRKETRRNLYIFISWNITRPIKHIQHKILYNIGEMVMIS